MDWRGSTLRFTRVSGPIPTYREVLPANPNRQWFSFQILNSPGSSVQFGPSPPIVFPLDRADPSDYSRGAGTDNLSYGTYSYNDYGPAMQYAVSTIIAAAGTIMFTECLVQCPGFTDSRYGYNDRSLQYRHYRWRTNFTTEPLKVMPSNPSRKLISFGFIEIDDYRIMFGPSVGNLTTVGMGAVSTRGTLWYNQTGPIICEPCWVQNIPPNTVNRAYMTEIY